MAGQQGACAGPSDRGWHAWMWTLRGARAPSFGGSADVLTHIGTIQYCGILHSKSFSRHSKKIK